MTETLPSHIETHDGEPFEHPALFYRGMSDYLPVCVSFINEGLSNGEPVAVAVPTANLAALRAELGQSAERVRLLDMSRAGRNPGRILPGVLHAFADAHADARRVRIIGEPIWAGRSDVEYPACVQHEALINLAFAGQAVEILCPYDTQRLPAAILADAEATHPTLIDANGRRPSNSYAPDRVLADYNQPFPEPVRSTTLRLSVEEVSDARQLAVIKAHRAGLNADRTAEFELAVSELVTNSIEHGDGHCRLRIWLEDGHLVAETHNPGQLRDPLAGRRLAQPEQQRGRGLVLVNHFTDLVRVHTTTRTTTIRIYMNRQTDQ